MATLNDFYFIAFTELEQLSTFSEEFLDLRVVTQDIRACRAGSANLRGLGKGT